MYDTLEHPALGQSPREAFATGVLASGQRPQRRIPYDEDFRLLTLPTTAKGTAKLQPRLGVKIHSLYYWADAFVAPGDQVERLMYGFSILCCLHAGMADQPSAATGTVMRVGTLERYAAEAGLGRTEVLPIANDFFRFYRLRP